MNPKRILVTGGAGFIGSHLVDQLIQQGDEVIVFDNFVTGRIKNLSVHKRLKIIEGDVRDLKALKSACERVDVLFHLATHCVRLSLTEPSINHEVNATGTLNSLVAAKEANVGRYVYCSSSEVYGNAAHEGLLSEESPKIPTTIYGASKLVGEHYTLAFHQTYGLSTVVARPFNAYGPRSHLEGPYGEVIPRFSIWLKASMEPVIFGDGLQTRDFTYVEDTAAGLIAASNCDAILGESVNLARGEAVSVVRIAETLSSLMGIAPKAKYGEERPGDIRRLGSDSRKAQRLFPELFQTSLVQGLKSYLAWLDEQRPNYRALAAKLTEKNWILNR